MEKSVKISIAAGAGCAVLWLPLWLICNVGLGLVASFRGDPSWAQMLTKEAVNSGVGTWAAFAITAHFVRRVDWRIAFATFAVAVTLLAGYQAWWNAEYYLTAQQVNEFRSVIAWSALGFLAAVVTGWIMTIKYRKAAQ